MALPKGESRRMQRKIEIWEGAKALVLRRDLSAIPRLVGTLAISKDPEERAAAAHALGGLHDKRALAALISTLKNKGERPKVRGMAAEALSNLCMHGGNTQVERARLAALSDRSAEVRFWSVFALGDIRSRKALPALQRLVETDKAVVRHWWSVAKEASDAIKRIEGQTAPGAKSPKRRTKKKRRA